VVWGGVGNTSAKILWNILIQLLETQIPMPPTPKAGP
jgi:hypothetical protein